MAYNNYGGGSTLTPDERAQEARRILTRLQDENEDERVQKLTAAAR